MSSPFSTTLSTGGKCAEIKQLTWMHIVAELKKKLFVGSWLVGGYVSVDCSWSCHC